MKTAALVLFALAAAPAAAQEARGMVVLRGTYDENVYLAGGTVDSRAKVRGDVTAAGGQVALVGTVAGDVLAAGGQVRFAGDVGGEAVAAASSIVQTRIATGRFFIFFISARGTRGPARRGGGRPRRDASSGCARPADRRGRSRRRGGG